MQWRWILWMALAANMAGISAASNVLDYGAKADGKTDDTAAIQKALDAAGNQTTDIGRIENVHFNPHAWGRCTFNDKATGEGWKTLCAYLEQNFVGFQIGKTDWEYMSGCFVILAKTGLHFVKTPSGEPNVVLTQCGSDIGPIGVQVDACQSHAGLAFTNCQFMATVKIGSENQGPVKFNNCGFWPIEKTGSQAILAGQGTTTFVGCHFAGWGRDGSKSPCIDVQGGGPSSRHAISSRKGSRNCEFGPRLLG